MQRRTISWQTQNNKKAREEQMQVFCWVSKHSKKIEKLQKWVLIYLA